MKIRTFADETSVVRTAVEFIAAEATAAITARGRFVMAVSGGRTPWQMLRALADEQLPWELVHVAQVDERVAPAGDPVRNLTHLRENLLQHSPLLPEHVYPMPVESPDLEAAAAEYELILRELAGSPIVLDVVHLGLGADGHTASLVPGDPVLEAEDGVALSGVYQGKRRMTLTYPVLNRARCVLWLVTGADKVGSLQRLWAGDQTIPAGRVVRDHAVVLADSAAAAALPLEKPQPARWAETG